MGVPFGLIREAELIKEYDLIKSNNGNQFYDALTKDGKTVEIKTFLKSDPSLTELTIDSNLTLAQELNKRLKADLYLIETKKEGVRFLTPIEFFDYCFNRVYIDRQSPSRGGGQKIRVRENYQSNFQIELLKQLGKI
jgi:hypothetical protein